MDHFLCSRHRTNLYTIVIGLIFLSVVLAGCSRLLDSFFNNSLPPDTGEQRLAGLTAQVTVKRDNLGIPFIDAASLDDLVMAMGYVSACDRFAQMEGFRLVGQGRLAEMAGSSSCASTRSSHS